MIKETITTTTVEKNTVRQRIAKLFFPTLAIVAVIFASYFYLQLYRLQQDPQAIAQKEVEELVSKVEKLMVLPEGEVPTVATVSDPAALKDQLFFANSKKGDKVLIYTTSKKAILYSVDLNKIVEVAPLSIGETEKTNTNTAPVSAPTNSNSETQ